MISFICLRLQTHRSWNSTRSLTFPSESWILRFYQSIPHETYFGRRFEPVHVKEAISLHPGTKALLHNLKPARLFIEHDSSPKKRGSMSNFCGLGHVCVRVRAFVFPINGASSV